MPGALSGIIADMRARQATGQRTQEQQAALMQKQIQDTINNTRLQQYANLAQQREAQAQQARIQGYSTKNRTNAAVGNLYQKMSTLPPNATAEDAMPIAAEAAAAGVPEAYVAHAMRMRGFGAAPKAAKETPTDKWLSTPVGALKGSSVVSADGSPISDPTMTVGAALKAGGAVLTEKNADLLKQAQEAADNLKGILATGEKILPKEPSLSAGTIAPIERWARTKMGDPDYAAYQHSLAGIIPYMRNLAGVGRVNQTELNLVVDRLQHANTYPALQSAVEQANRIIENSRAQITKAGRLNALAGRSLGGAMPAPKSSRELIGTTPDGKPVYRLPNGKLTLEP